ncbi:MULTISPECIES: glutathione S-transferase N-terminal domain-containing protein [unclassified Thioalkalivibrio]|uniref:glutathione S-transferase N-terminal domain-containing protein n=1 Tax=unclassified Thioalkalivibrio TaxID=2621013 RepID=UPI00035FAA73|nr:MULTISPECIES: glutathione S-transferase N-terminal domain-containing protein [unclassified Thioalkalivibrio]PYG03115.1 RNA polymerase-associated protein [Thioalkalivibrio sp. ALE21]
MALVANRRSVMTLFSAHDCVRCHRVRIILAEKDIAVDVVNLGPDDMPEDLSDLNPYNEVPTLVDRDLALYGTHVITEYLDERFPHPPLMPVDPVSRAAARLALYRVERDWYEGLDNLAKASGSGVSKARKVLKESFIASGEIFELKPYFLSDEFSIVDAAIAPVIWRLPAVGIELESLPQAIQDYAERVCRRESFSISLTEAERELRL